MTDNEIMPIEKAKFILRHGSAEGEHKYFEAIDVIEKEINRLQAEVEQWQGGYMTQKQEIANLEVELKAMRGAANSYKAEAERLKEKLNTVKSMLNEIIPLVEQELKTAKAEAYKEFAERLKERKYQSSDWSHGEHPYVVEESDIDDVYEEMVGDGNEN